MEVKKEMANARTQFAKMELEGEKPSKFFCSMNKKQVEKVQFYEVHKIEKDNNGKVTTKVIRDQNALKWDVRLFYWKFYHNEEITFTRNTQKVIES